MTIGLQTLPAGPSSASCCAPAVGLNSVLDAERVARLAKALAEPLRVRIVDVLRRSDEAVCQCELIALFEISQSLLSHHMRKLVDAGLVSVERRHKWAYYSIAPDAQEDVSACLERFQRDSVRRSSASGSQLEPALRR
jgi:ArsR family transcriptional regulator